MDVEEREISVERIRDQDLSLSCGYAIRQTGARYGFTAAVPNVYNPHAIRLLISGITRDRAPYDYSDVLERIADDVGGVSNAPGDARRLPRLP